MFKPIITRICSPCLAFLFIFVQAACTTPSSPTPSQRTTLTYSDLTQGFKPHGPVNETAFSRPPGAVAPALVFEGRLELIGEEDHGEWQQVAGSPDAGLGAQWSHLPQFDFAFVQQGEYLVPTQRGLVITDHPDWNYIVEPGRVWQEADDQGYTRVAFPFALVVKGGNAAFNGSMTFLFNDQSISQVWYQITQETTTSIKGNFWGLLPAIYHRQPVENAAQVQVEFDAELRQRYPTRPLAQLTQDYPGVDPSAFGAGIDPDDITSYGFVIDGINYVGPCHTRFGEYAFCESLRATSYSIAKSVFVSLALMRLEQKYGPGVGNLLIKDYLPEAQDSPGDWNRVTFNHMIDMSSGNFRSPGYMSDDNGAQMGAYFSTQPYTARIAAALNWPHSADPGTLWVYRTCDTFILSRALQNYLQSKEGPQADIFQFVVDEVYKPLKLSPSAFTSLRTADNNWQGQADGGYGLWLSGDDIAKITSFLSVQHGLIDGEQILSPAMLAAALQQDPADRGVDIDQRRKYNNAFWAQRYDQGEGYPCTYWVTQMLGVSGNVVALFPNGSSYYYFSDSDVFNWGDAMQQADRMKPFCP